MTQLAPRSAFPPLVHVTQSTQRKETEGKTGHHVALVRKSVPFPYPLLLLSLLLPLLLLLLLFLLLPLPSPPAISGTPLTARPPKDSANLARIRDNQRRSRARRKEYVQDLEARLRRVELQGVEAATEIQLAARRVADENRRLRALLNRHGVSDDAIEGYLAGGDGGEAAAVGRPVGRLDQLLLPRRPSCGSLGVPVRAESSEASATSDSGRNNGWDMTGHSPGAVSPLASGSKHIGGALPSPSGTSGMHHVGIYTIEDQGSDGHSPYSMGYDAGIQMPYVQLSSPQEYNSIPVDYFGRSRGFTQGQYHC